MLFIVWMWRPRRAAFWWSHIGVTKSWFEPGIHSTEWCPMYVGKSFTQHCCILFSVVFVNVNLFTDNYCQDCDSSCLCVCPTGRSHFPFNRDVKHGSTASALKSLVNVGGKWHVASRARRLVRGLAWTWWCPLGAVVEAVVGPTDVKMALLIPAGLVWQLPYQYSFTFGMDINIYYYSYFRFFGIIEGIITGHWWMTKYEGAWLCKALHFPSPLNSHSPTHWHGPAFGFS